MSFTPPVMHPIFPESLLSCSHLSYITPVLHSSSPASVLACYSPVQAGLHLSYPACVLSCICRVLHSSCVHLTCLASVLHCTTCSILYPYCTVFIHYLSCPASVFSEFVIRTMLPMFLKYFQNIFSQMQRIKWTNNCYSLSRISDFK